MDPYADAEVAFALTVSDYAAGQLLSAAYGAIDRIPALHEALGGGPAGSGQGQHVVQ